MTGNAGGPPTTVWTDLITEVAGSRARISQADYDRRRPPNAPTARTLVRWARQPWTELCTAAGKAAGGATPRPWPQADKIEAIRSAATTLDLDEHLTLQRYNDWRADQNDPSQYPSILAFGDGTEWLEWCRQAGVRGGRKRRRRHRYPDAQILEHLIAAGAGTGGVGTTAYERYRQTHPGTPVRATIIDRYGSWQQAVVAAAELAARRER